eukprot:349801-Chlamydomonas_euryale.AAC.17
MFINTRLGGSTKMSAMKSIALLSPEQSMDIITCMLDMLSTNAQCASVHAIFRAPCHMQERKPPEHACSRYALTGRRVVALTSRYANGVWEARTEKETWRRISIRRPCGSMGSCGRWALR